MWFYPTHRPDFYTTLEKVRLAAVNEAQRLSAEKKLKYVVERLKPVHLGLTTYKLPANVEKGWRLKDVCALFVAGVFNNADTFDYITWWEGKKATYIGEWFVRDIYYFKERQGVYAGNLEYYQFPPNASFTFYAHDTTVTATETDGWLIAFVVVPETERNAAIVTEI